MLHFNTITALLLVVLALGFASLAFSPALQAVTPASDGGYPNFNTAEGDDALFSLTNGSHNTANGFRALYSNITGQRNTATRGDALYGKMTGDANTATGFDALVSNTAGGFNTANGDRALSNK